MNERIKKLRKALGLTQQEFAERIGSVQNTITGYETGRRVPSSQVITLICKEFNVDETWLRTGEGEIFVQKDREGEIALMVQNLLSGESSDFKTRLITVLSKLKEEQWLALEEKMYEIIGSRSEPPAELQPTPRLQPAPAPDITRELAEKVTALERQNQELMERLEAIEKEDAILEAAEKSSRSRETGLGSGTSRFA